MNVNKKIKTLITNHYLEFRKVRKAYWDCVVYVNFNMADKVVHLQVISGICYLHLHLHLHLCI